MEWMEEYQVIVSTAFVASQRSREIKATDRHETVELGFVSVNHQSGAWGVISVATGVWVFCKEVAGGRCCCVCLLEYQSSQG